jgi:hypothetical protein
MDVFNAQTRDLGYSATSLDHERNSPRDFIVCGSRSRRDCLKLILREWQADFGIITLARNRQRLERVGAAQAFLADSKIRRRRNSRDVAPEASRLYATVLGNVIADMLPERESCGTVNSPSLFNLRDERPV